MARSRVVAVVGAYSAMTADRPYCEARTEDDAREELRRSAGSYLDPALVEALLVVLAAERAVSVRVA